MHRTANKQVYEVDAWINDIFYGRSLQDTNASYDKMGSNYGYGKKNASSAEVSADQM